MRSCTTLAVSTASGNNDRSQLQFQMHGSMVGAIDCR
jgi:hypothetical protein